jgi:Large extracellular alpha-helical protein
MKKLLNKNNLFYVLMAFILLVIVGLTWINIHQDKPVNLDRNAGLTPKDNTIVLEVEPLTSRNAFINSNGETILRPIPTLNISAKEGNESSGSSWDSDCEEDCDFSDTSRDGNEFIAFEYQDKDVSSLITMTPERSGTWFAHGGSRLVFTPQKDWLPEQKYTVTISKDLIAPEVKVDKTKLTFTTPDNSIIIEKLSLDKDYTQKKKFDINAKVFATYPLDEKKFAKGVSLTLDKKALTPQITFDTYKRYAFIKYENVSILPKEQVANLEIKHNKETKRSSINIPSQSKYFKIIDIAATVQKNEKNVPEQLLVIEFSDYVDSKQLKDKVDAYLVKKGTKITTKVLNTAKKLPLEQVVAEEETNIHSFKFDFNDEKSEYNIYVKVKPVIVSQSGFTITKEQESSVRVPQYPKEISIMGDGAIIPLSSSKVLNMVSLGVDKFTVTLARILPNQINHLISQTYGNIKNPQFRNYSFDEKNMSEVFTKDIKLNSDYKTPNYSSVNLADYMKQGKGLFLVNAKADWQVEDRRLIMVSDIGIIYKEAEDGTSKLYAVSLAQEKPLKNAKVEVLAVNGTVIKTLYTNDEGIAEIPDLSDYEYEKEPVAFIVKTDNDFNYIPYNRGDRYVSYSKYDVSGDIYDRDLEVFAWTDRGLYLPGEKVDFALIAKNKNWTTTAGLPINIRITDPRGTKVFEKDFSLTKEGLMDFSYQLQETSPIGHYVIDIYFRRKDDKDYLSFLSDTSFKVEEYEEDKIKVSSSISTEKAKGWFLTKDPLKVDVEVQNLYGSAAQGNEVKGKVRLVPSAFSFKDFSDYKFIDNSQDDETLIYPETISLTPQKTDVEGKTTFEIDLNKYSKGTYSMRFTAEAFEQESSKSVSSYASALISPQEYIVGYKTVSSLSFLNKNAEAKINYIALNNNLEKIDLRGLTLVLKELKYVSALTKQYDGYRYQTVLQEKEISKQNFEIAKQGLDFVLPTDKPGKYALVLYNSSGESLSKVEFFVAGNTNTSFNLEKDAQLTMYLNKDNFIPGEEIEINLITPYAGVGLITLESDDVYASKWFTTDTNSTVQKIKIPNTVEGGVYVNVSFARRMTSEEIFVSPYSYTVKYVKVEPVNKTLNIDLKMPERVQPGEELKIEYKTSAPAKIIVFGSSEGLLQVARYRTPNPLNYFFRKKMLDVRTYQILDLFLPDFTVMKETLAVGGDTSSESALDLLLANEFRRNRLAPVTFWSSVLQAEKTTKTYTYKVPDYFNGTMRIMAVAVNEKGVGSEVNNVKVKAPVILNMSAPRMAAPGDIFEVGLRIANEHEKLSQGDFTAEIKTTEGLKVVGSEKQDISLAKGAQKTIYFKVQALDKFGNNDITATVKEKSLNETYKTTYSLSVRPASPYKVNIDMGNDLNKKFTIKDFVLRDLYTYRENRTLSVSQNPLALFLSLDTFLKNYPYGCTEQISSKVFPRLAYGVNKGKEEQKQVQEELNVLLDKLVSRQNEQGAISLWDNGYGDDELTMYVSDLLLSAEELGYNIRRPVLNKAMERIKKYISRVPYSDSQAKLMVYGHYLLAKDGDSFGSYLSSLENYLDKNMPSYKQNIEGAYLAATYQMLQDKKKAQDLIKSYEPQDKEKYTYYSDYDTSLTRNAKYIYIVAKYFPEQLKNKKEKEILKLMVRDIVMNNYNTFSASYSMAALALYAQQFKTAETLFKITCKDTPLKVKEGDITSVSALPLSCKNIDVSADKEAPLGNFWYLEQSGYDKQAPKKYSNGIEIYKEFLNEKGEVAKEIKAGEDLTVRIKIKSLTGKTISNVAVVDMFASPFVFVRDSLQGHYTFAEHKEDRLVIFGDYGPQTSTLTYKVKVANAGEFVVPAVTAQAMYNNALNASGEEGKLIVQKR